MRKLVATYPTIFAVVLLAGTTSAQGQGIPSSNTLQYGGVAYENNAPAPASLTVDVTVLRSNGTVACMGSGTTSAGGRFSVPLPNTCVSAIESDSGIRVEVRMNNVLLGAGPVSAAPYAVEAKNAQLAVDATNAANAASAASATPGGPLDQRLADVEAPKARLRCILTVDQSMPVTDTQYRVAFNSCPLDTNQLNPTTGSGFAFTAPRDGEYRVHAYAEAAVSSFPSGGGKAVRLRLVQVPVGQAPALAAGAADGMYAPTSMSTVLFTPSLTTIVSLGAGDQLYVEASQFASANGVALLSASSVYGDRTYLVVEEL